jgi:hypothetical protein
MKKLVCFALAALSLPSIATAQNLPAIDVFGGYSYLNFDQPTSGLTAYQTLKMNGWDVSGSVGLFHHLAVEGDLSGHSVGDCGGISGVNCSNFSYMLGARYNLGDRSSRITAFVHGLVGQDRADLLGLSSTTVSDTSVALAVGGGVDFWVYRHIGLQLGPADYVYTNHLNNDNGTSQGSFRVAAGVAFRFGGDFPPPEPKQPKAPKAESDCHRSWVRPWHKDCPAPAPTGGEPAEGQASESHRSAGTSHKTPPPQPAPTPGAPTSAPPTSHGLRIYGIGIVAAPQEFEGAKILQIEPGSVAEMASLHVGDLITSVDGQAIKTPMELAAALSDKTGKVRIGVMRGKLAVETVILVGGK